MERRFHRFVGRLCRFSQPSVKQALKNRFDGQSDIALRLDNHWTVSCGINRDNLVGQGKCRAITQVKKPSDCLNHVEVFLRDGIDCCKVASNNSGYYFVGYYLHSKHMGVPNPIHGGRTNVLWVDGHCRSEKREQFWSPTADSVKYRDYWKCD